MDQVDRRNNEQGRITKLLDANCAGRLSLHLLTNQRLLSICICITNTNNLSGLTNDRGKKTE